jgi:deoxycytidylate deaminase
MHAEMNVLRWSRPGDTLIVYRFKKDGSPTMAKPCSDCRRMIITCGIKKVTYTDWEGNLHSYKPRRLK